MAAANLLTTPSSCWAPVQHCQLACLMRHAASCHITTAVMLLLLLLQSSPPEGSILFSYVQTDEFCERFEASRCITTSKREGQNHLARKLATDARNRQKVRTPPYTGV